MDKDNTFQIGDIIKDKHDNYYLVLNLVGDRLTVQSFKESKSFTISAGITKNFAIKVG